MHLLFNYIMNTWSRTFNYAHMVMRTEWLYTYIVVITYILFHRYCLSGSWLKVNGEAIYKTKPWKYQNDSVNKDVW